MPNIDLKLLSNEFIKQSVGDCYVFYMKEVENL